MIKYAPSQSLSWVRKDFPWKHWLTMLQGDSHLAIFFISLWKVLNFIWYWWSMTHFAGERWQNWLRIGILIKTQKGCPKSPPKSDVKIQNVGNFTQISINFDLSILISLLPDLVKSVSRTIFINQRHGRMKIEKLFSLKLTKLYGFWNFAWFLGKMTKFHYFDIWFVRFVTINL